MIFIFPSTVAACLILLGMSDYGAEEQAVASTANDIRAGRYWRPFLYWSWRIISGTILVVGFVIAMRTYAISQNQSTGPIELNNDNISGGNIGVDDESATPMDINGSDIHDNNTNVKIGN